MATTQPVEPTAPPEPEAHASIITLPTRPRQNPWGIGHLLGALLVLGGVVAAVIAFSQGGSTHRATPANQSLQQVQNPVAPDTTPVTDAPAAPGVVKSPPSVVTNDPRLWMQIWYNQVGEAYSAHDASLLKSSFVSGSGGMQSETEAVNAFTGEPGTFQVTSARVTFQDRPGLSMIVEYSGVWSNGNTLSGHVDLSNKEGPWKVTDIYKEG